MRIAPALLLLACATTVASAEPKSWTAVKGRLPPDLVGVGTIDVAAVKGAASNVLAALVAEDKNAAQMFELVEKTCKLDPAQVVADLTVVGDEHDQLLVLGLVNTDEAKLVACANQVIGTVVPSAMVESTKDRGVTMYGIKGDADVKLATAWLAKDVVAIYLTTYKSERHLLLDALVANKATPKTALAKYLAEASKPGAVAFGAASIHEDGVDGGYGRVVASKGKLAFSIHAFATDAEHGAKLLAEAKQGVTEAQGEIDRKTKRKPAKAARLAAIGAAIKSASLSGKGAELDIEVAITEAALVDTLLGLFEM